MKIKRTVKRITSLTLLGVLLITSSTSLVFGASQITKTYDFNPESETYLHYEVPKTIKERGKEYKLKDVNYAINEEQTIRETKKIKTIDKEKYPKTITKKVNGETYILTAPADINWKETSYDEVTKVQEFLNKNDIPQQINSTKKDENDEDIDIVLNLTDVREKTRTESFTAPAKFYSYVKEHNEYVFNGKTVVVSNSSPTWSGYKDDVKEYLGLNGSQYVITGGKWTSELTASGDKFVRTASYTGTRTVPLYEATFVESDETSKGYTADVTYSYLVATATAVYEPAFSKAAIIAIGAGVVILIIGLICILYTIAKRKREDQAEVR